MCSLEARGLWIELLCIMHNANRRGYLETPQGAPLDDDQTSRLIGAFKDDLYRCKCELLEHGVFSVEESSGVIYCRRMIKETIKAEKCANAGRSGGGNPALNKENKENTQILDTRNHISLKATFKGQIIEILDSVPEQRREILQTWLAYKSECGKSYKPAGLKALIKKHESWSDSKLQDSINQSMAMNYAGLFEPAINKANNYHRHSEEVRGL
jgi:hypothetical protein